MDQNKRQLSIVLDMDGTLIGPEGNARPHLDDFLYYCFSEFFCVGIWTYASQEWFELVNETVFVPILHRIAARLNIEKVQFHFVYTRDKCVVKREPLSLRLSGETIRSERIVLKPLRKVWKRKDGVFADITSDNVLVVDDTAATFGQNYGNAIRVPEYVVGSKDKTLLHLRAYLGRLSDIYVETGTIRKTDKRNWLGQAQLADDECKSLDRL